LFFITHGYEDRPNQEDFIHVKYIKTLKPLAVLIFSPPSLPCQHDHNEPIYNAGLLWSWAIPNRPHLTWEQGEEPIIRLKLYILHRLIRLDTHWSGKLELTWAWCQ